MLAYFFASLLTCFDLIFRKRQPACADCQNRTLSFLPFNIDIFAVERNQSFALRRMRKTKKQYNRLKTANKILMFFIIFLTAEISAISLIRCKFDADLLLSIQNHVVNQPNIAKANGNRQQNVVFTDFFNRFKRFVINNRNIINLGKRFGFNRLCTISEIFSAFRSPFLTASFASSQAL